MLLAEDLLLLLTDDKSGRVRGEAGPGVGAALLIDLALMGRIRITEKGERDHKPDRVIIENPAPTDHPVLDAALAKISDRPRAASDAVSRLDSGFTKPLLAGLAAQGLLTEEKQTFLGLPAGSKWAPAEENNHELQVRRALVDVLLGGQEPDVHLACLIALLSGIDQIEQVVIKDNANLLAALDIDAKSIDKKALKKRAKELESQNFAAEGARKAIEAATAAIASSIAVTAAISASS